MRWTRPGLLLLSAALSACSGGGASVRPGSGAAAPDLPESDQPLLSTSARCASGTGGGACECRPVDEYGVGVSATDRESSEPAPGTKRFELRTGRGTDVMNLTVAGRGTYRKAADIAEAGCVYVDLPPGKHALRFHVHARSTTPGVEARLLVSEYSPRFAAWYRTFAFRCAGDSGPCAAEDARAEVERLRAVPRGLFEPCGSTRVQGIRYSVEAPPDRPVEDFNLQLVLNVYAFEPRFPPGSKTCKGPSEEAADIQP